MIVAKFGSSSLNTADHFRNIRTILSDQHHDVIVVSAIGKGEGTHKITDLLLMLFENRDNDRIALPLLETIVERHKTLLHSLDKSIDVTVHLNYLRHHYRTMDYSSLLSYGEYLSGRIMADYLNYTFADAKTLIVFQSNGSVDLEETRKRVNHAYQHDQKLVIPGFYGSLENKIHLFARGGSDISAAVIAYVLDADIYENWKDVDGVYESRQACYEQKQPYRQLTYQSLYEIVKGDHGMVHADAIGYVREKQIPIHIRNINSLNSGTCVKGVLDHE